MVGRRGAKQVQKGLGNLQTLAEWVVFGSKGAAGVAFLPFGVILKVPEARNAKMSRLMAQNCISWDPGNRKQLSARP